MDQSDGTAAQKAYGKYSVFSKNLDIIKDSSIAWTLECLEATELTEFKQEWHSHMSIWITFKDALKKPRDHGNT